MISGMFLISILAVLYSVAKRVKWKKVKYKLFNLF